MIVTALASPISYEQKSQNNKKGRDLVLALDTSGSMGESGFNTEKKELRKFDIVVSVLNNFIDKRYDDNMGVVVFGTYAFASVPLTYDTNALKYIMQFLDVGMVGDNTAIGEAIEQSNRVLSMGEASKKVIILLSDGFTNSGSISVKEALKYSLKNKIKIYTIGLGKKGDFDENLLKLIAKNSKGKFFHANNADDLHEVYSELNSLEPSPIRSQHYLHKNLLFGIPLFIAILLFIFMLLKRFRLKQ
jgi:Ca-activated chloride channel family protein